MGHYPVVTTNTRKPFLNSSLYHLMHSVDLESSHKTSEMLWVRLIILRKKRPPTLRSVTHSRSVRPRRRLPCVRRHHLRHGFSSLPPASSPPISDISPPSGPARRPWPRRRPCRLTTSSCYRLSLNRHHSRAPSTLVDTIPPRQPQNPNLTAAAPINPPPGKAGLQPSPTITALCNRCRRHDGVVRSLPHVTRRGVYLS
jgi:hypothetical protein